MKDWKVAIEIDLRKVLLAAVLAGSVALAVYADMTDTLLVIVPAGLACMFGKERDNETKTR